MLIRNINTEDGLSNGTKLIITNLNKHVIEAKIITGKNIDTKVFIPRIIFRSDEIKDTLSIRRQQFPIRLAFRMTINKSQGQTLKKVSIFIDSPLFSHGQLYTAMSRVSDISSLKYMIRPETFNSKTGYFVDNIVFKEVFSNILL